MNGRPPGSGSGAPGDLSPDELHRRLDAFWSPPPGLGRLAAVNHTVVGRRFIVTGFVFFLIGGVLALLMRTQLAVPGNTFLGYEAYNQFFTMHGTTMMFLFAVPIMEGFAVYLIPKMIGARDLVFPRLSAFGYWCYLFGGLLLYSSFLVGHAPDGGWFMYVPLTGEEYTPGPNSDFWLLGVTFVEISAVAAGVELVVTILKTRAPGMAIHRMPLFAWYILVVALMIVFGFPPLIMASILLEVERSLGLPFFDTARGGDPLLWQHLFWLFGHPEVYIIFLPAAGVVSMVLPVLARRPIAGYVWVALAAVATGFLSFGLWVHHMFVTGIPHLALAFFSAASMAVAIPSGIQVFAWIATLWGGRPVINTPMLFILGFLFIFVLGGLTGVMVAMVSFNWQVHDTHFVVAHLHYVLIGGMVFPLFAGLYYWLPQSTGRMLSERLGRWAFWLMFIGFNVTFLPMHLTGLIGMPRRVYTYPEIAGWDWLNLTSTVGAYVFAAGVLVFIVDVATHYVRGRAAGVDPWRANTLEWTIQAPVPNYNFASIPEVVGRDPLWQQQGLIEGIRHGRFYLGDPSARRRETLGTSVLGGELESVVRLAHPTWVPLVTASFTAVFFVGFLARAYGIAALGAGLAVVSLLAWAWIAAERGGPDAIDAGRGRRLPLHYASPQAPSWWATLMTVWADGVLFASLVFAYYFLWVISGAWPPAAHPEGELLWPAVALGLLLLSSAAIGWAKAGNRRDNALARLLGLAAALVLALVFALLQLGALEAADIDPTEHAYSALIYAIVVFHLIHLGIAVLMAGFTLVRALAGQVSAVRAGELRNTALFWHYTGGVWVVGFVTLHLFPLLQA